LSRLRFKISMSLDGFVAGPRQSVDNPLGIGGANAAQQYLAAGLVDEMEINVVPTLLGGGEPLFVGVGDDLRGLELVRTVAAPKVTHLKFARR
jgi:dihydrofolate reductase